MGKQVLPPFHHHLTTTTIRSSIHPSGQAVTTFSLTTTHCHAILATAGKAIVIVKDQNYKGDRQWRKGLVRKGGKCQVEIMGINITMGGGSVVPWLWWPLYVTN